MQQVLLNFRKSTDSIKVLCYLKNKKLESLFYKINIGLKANQIFSVNI